MSQGGGSATINGVLYQILGSIAHLSRIALQCKVEADECNEATLVIEPKGGGGDIQIRAGNARIVEQWKVKSDGGPWSVRSIVEEVIPDLFLAVDADRLMEKGEYRFVTEGHEGRFKATNDFLGKIIRMAVPADPFAVLDNSIKHSFLEAIS